MKDLDEQRVLIKVVNPKRPKTMKAFEGTDVYGLFIKRELVITIWYRGIEMMQESGSDGAKVWLIPDAYLPSSGLGEKYEGHEAICVLNTTSSEANLNISFFFADREPLEDVWVKVGAERSLHLRLDHPEELGGVVLRRDIPYGIKIRSDTNITVQYSRLDVAQSNYTLMTTIPYFQD